MRDALRANDQELYFRILCPHRPAAAGLRAEALPGQPPAGLGHLDHRRPDPRAGLHLRRRAAGLPRRSRRAATGASPTPTWRPAGPTTSGGWPSIPGLPIEGYLPAWFVSQLSRGDVRLPGRAMGARARLERAETLARTRPGAPPRDAAPAAGPLRDGGGPPGPRVSAAPRRPARSPAPGSRCPAGAGSGAPADRRPAEPPRRAGERTCPPPVSGTRPSRRGPPRARSAAPHRPAVPVHPVGDRRPHHRPGRARARAGRQRPAGRRHGPAPGNGNGGPQAALGFLLRPQPGPRPGLPSGGLPR